MMKSLLFMLISTLSLCSQLYAQSPAIVYASSSSGLSEIESTNDGTIEGSITATISDGSFSNASGTLTSSDFRITNLPSGLSATLDVSTDGKTATLILQGKARNHQPSHNLSNLIFTFENAAFIDVSASEVTNATDALSGVSLSFFINPWLSYAGDDFLEIPENDGSVTGSISISIFNNTFSNPGGNLNTPDDFTITNLPEGLTAAIDVNGDGTSLIVRILGKAVVNQTEDNLSNLRFTFEDGAFANEIFATTVFYAINHGSNIGIDYNDNPELSYTSATNVSSPLNIKDAVYSGVSLNLDNSESSSLDMSPDGSILFITQKGSISMYLLSTPFDISTAIFDKTMSPSTGYVRDLEFNSSGTILLLITDENTFNTTRLIERFDLTEPFDISTAAASNSPSIDPFDSLISHFYEINISGDLLKTFALSDDGLQLYIPRDEALIIFDLDSAYDLGSLHFNQILRTASSGKEINISSIEFSENGEQMYLVEGNRIFQYTLTVPFDISTVRFNQFEVQEFDRTPQGFIFINSDSKALTLDIRGLKEFEFLANGFLEKEENDGSLDGTVEINLVNAVFSKTGSTLTFETDYNIQDLPNGLVPVLTVADDGKSAQLTLTASASIHDRANDLDSVILSFENSAFESIVDIADFINATEANLGVPIRFTLDNTTSPLATITTPTTLGESGSSFLVTVTFSESVSNFEKKDIFTYPVIWEGSISDEVQNLTSNADSTEFTFDLIISGDAIYELTLFNFSAFNASGNGNLIGDTIRFQTGTFRNSLPIIEDQTFTVDQFTPDGTFVGDIFASDPENDKLSYAIYNNPEDNYSIEDVFDISASNGVIWVKDELQLNTFIRESFSFTVEVTDDIHPNSPSSAQIIINVVKPLGIDEPNPQTNISIYPNPAEDLVFISHDFIQHPITYEVVDLSGKTVLTQTNNSGNGLDELNISNIHAGIYIIKVVSKETSSSYIMKKI